MADSQDRNPDADHLEAADRAEREADDLERRSESLGQEAKEARTSWEQKRADPSVPGANPPEGDTQQGISEAAEAPPENASPADAETPTEGAVGPPADS